MFKKIIATALAGTMIFSLAACSTTSNSSSNAPAGGGDTIRIGAWEPLTGAMASGGSQIKDGYEMAKSLRPTVLGKNVELVYADNKSDKVEAANSMTRLVEKEKVVAVLGCYSSGLTIAGAAITEKAQIPLLPLATSPLVTDGNKYITRTNYQDPVAGTVMAQYAVNSLGSKKVGMLRDITSDYSIGLANYFKEAYVKATGDANSVIITDFSAGDANFSAQLNTLKSENVDTIFIPTTYNDAAMIAIQAKEAGINVPLMGGDSCEAPELIEIGGQAVEGFLYCSHFAAGDNPSEKTKAFLDLYAKTYPGKDVSSNTVIGFENYNLLLDAIEAVGSTDAAKVNEWLHNVKDWEGVTGFITINPETGNPIKPVPINKVENGKFVYVDTITPQ